MSGSNDNASVIPSFFRRRSPTIRYSQLSSNAEDTSSTSLFTRTIIKRLLFFGILIFCIISFIRVNNTIFSSSTSTPSESNKIVISNTTDSASSNDGSWHLVTHSPEINVTNNYTPTVSPTTITDSITNATNTSIIQGSNTTTSTTSDVNTTQPIKPIPVTSFNTTKADLDSNTTSTTSDVIIPSPSNTTTSSNKTLDTESPRTSNWIKIPTDDETLESVFYKLVDDSRVVINNTSDSFEIKSTLLQVKLSSNRSPCDTNHCIYRIYVEGPTLNSAYFHQNYYVNVTLYEPGTYKLLVALESLRNSSTTVGSFKNDFAISFDENQGGYQLLDRVAATSISIKTDNEVLTAETYASVMPRCEYTVKNMETNEFTWMPVSTLKARSFTSEQTLLLPPELLDSTGTTSHFISQMRVKRNWDDPLARKAQDEHPEWIQPFQNTVLHGRTCSQPLITASDFKSKFNNVNLVFLGTSRLEHIYGVLRSFLEPTSAISRMSLGFLEIKTVSPSEIPRLYRAHFARHTICKKSDSRFKDETIVFVLTEGIWEARAHEARDGVFTMEGARAGLEYIQKMCKDFKYKVVMLTNPATQPLDIRHDPFAERTRFFKLFYSLSGPRLEYAKWTYAKLAAENNYRIVDLFKASLPRRDVSIDNIHYILFNREKHEKLASGIRIGNEATFGYSQLTLAAIVQALEEE